MSVSPAAADADVRGGAGELGGGVRAPERQGARPARAPAAVQPGPAHLGARRAAPPLLRRARPRAPRRALVLSLSSSSYSPLQLHITCSSYALLSHCVVCHLQQHSTYFTVCYNTLTPLSLQSCAHRCSLRISSCNQSSSAFTSLHAHLHNVFATQIHH